ncbi:uncharacterized protein LOC110180776 [Drosophila serrata]|uniref:uncharacterized protein LOC110180776 n=1 Tax=Drosophila serrata TaxID=7274 RepID=UPI000A1D128D|nr:uncharacterized protein LOC110180776 [Drosophila serrata]
MIFLPFWWTLLVLYGLGSALEAKDAKQQLKEGSKINDFSQIIVQKSKDTNSANTQIRSENQPYKQKDEAVDQDNTSMKCPAIPDEPEDNYKFYKMDKMELSDRFHKVLFDRLPEELTDIVFELIYNDTAFEQVLSVLEGNLKTRKQKLRLQVEEGDNYCKIMTKQKCCRNINPLVPRLQEFYDIILKTADQEQKIRKERQNSLWILAKNYTNRTSQQQNLTIGNKLAETAVHDEL